MSNVYNNLMTVYTEQVIKDTSIDPFNHIKLYAHLKVIEHYVPTMSIQFWQEIVFSYFNINYKLFSDWEVIEEARINTRIKTTHIPPKPAIAAALRALGFGRTAIAEIMHLSESAVNYHLASKMKYYKYTNPDFKKIQSNYMRNLHPDEQVNVSFEHIKW